MNHKSLFTLVLLSCLASVHAARDVTPTIINRSQGRDAAWKLAGLSEKVHLNSDAESTYVNLNANLAYAQSFRSNRLAECLFGDDLVGCNQILIQGSEVADRNAHAWLADYFYLPTDYDASFSIRPKVTSGLANLDLYVGLDDWVDGMYLRVHGPIVWSKWDLHFNEQCDQNFTNSHRLGYFTWDGMSNDQLLETFGEYAQGKAPLNTSGFPQDVNGDSAQQATIGVTFQGLNYAKMERCPRSRTGFADLRFELGYDMLSCEDYHFGLNVQVAAPTGSRRQAEFAFDPTIGNGNHWEVGGGVTAHYIAWRCEAEDKFVGLYLDANFTHINNAKEQRTFDLKCRPNSRYMLAEKLGTPTQFLRAGTTTSSAGSTTIPVKQFAGEFAPVANLTTVDVHVRATFQADIALMVNYTTNNWGFDLGYDFWARSSEKISLPSRPSSKCCPNLCTMEKNQWALKGDAAVFGFMSASSGSSGAPRLFTNNPVALSATECGATIHKGTNADADVADCTGNDTLQNCGVDNAQFGYGRGTPTATSADQLLVFQPNLTADSDAVKTSVEPIFINCCDINFQRTKGISHKVFGNINYTWELDSFTPYFGAGASGEFASRSSEDCCTDGPVCGASCADSCCDIEDSPNSIKCALSEWRVWLQGGLHFD